MLFRAHFPTWLQSPINCGAVTMLAGFVIVILVSAVTPKSNKAEVDEIFTCYNKIIDDTNN